MIRSRELGLFRNELPFKKPILDFGCGDGFFTKVLYGDCGKIDFGTDVDEKALCRAKKEGIYTKLVKYNGERLPLGNNTSATVISNCVLEHVDDLEGNVSEIFRILKPKGKFVCTVMTSNWECYLFGKIFLRSLYQKWMRKKQIHKHLLSKNGWDTKFKQAGFKIEKSVGYLDERASRWLDFLHYVSLPSLVSYKLLGKWVLFPWQYDLVPVDRWFRKMVDKKVSSTKSAALFYELRK